MIVTPLSILLAALAIGGAFGVLLLRRVTHCVYAFLVCCVALAGLYVLLNNPFAAAVQLIGLLGAGLLLTLGISVWGDRPPRRRWAYLPLGLIWLAIGGWAIAGGSIGESVLTSAPMWAARIDAIPALGKELLTKHTVLFELFGLFLLVSMVGVAYAIRHSRRMPGH